MWSYTVKGAAVESGGGGSVVFVQPSIRLHDETTERAQMIRMINVPLPPRKKLKVEKRLFTFEAWGASHRLHGSACLAVDATVEKLLNLSLSFHVDQRCDTRQQQLSSRLKCCCFRWRESSRRELAPVKRLATSIVCMLMLQIPFVN